MSDDLISRKEAINRIEAIMPPLPSGDYQEGIALGLVMAKMAIKEQSSVQSETKTGCWQEVGGFEPWQTGYLCSECDNAAIAKFDFCPNCGAKMEETENE